MGFAMSRALRLLVPALLLAALHAPAGAATVTSGTTGQQLLALCTANMGGTGNALEAAECMGYVVGVSETFNCIQSDHGFTWNSEGVGQPQLVAVVVSWLQAHPEALEFEAHRVVGAALQAAYPCK